MRKTYFSLPTFERYRVLAKQTTPSTDRDLSLGVVLHFSAQGLDPPLLHAHLRTADKFEKGVLFLWLGLPPH